MAIEIQAMGDAMYEQPAQEVQEVSQETNQGTDQEVQEVQEPTQETGINTEEVEESKEDVEKESGTTDSNGGKDKESKESEESEPEFYFGETPVTIEIPDDIRKEMSEKGIDVNDIVSELYAKDSDFTLKGETYEKLCNAFGKFSVDTYVNSLKLQNETFIANLEREHKEQEQANEVRYSEMLEMIGGEDAWNDIESFALESLSDEELRQVNQIMESGNSFAQNLAIVDLQNRMKETKGDSKVDLLDATPAVDTSDEGSTPLDRAEYMRLTSELSTKYRHDPESYAKEQAKLDARRRKALQ